MEFLRNRVGAFVVILCIFSCSTDSGEPEVQVPSKLPFDSFWLSTQFGESDDPKAKEYFNTWVEVVGYPASSVQTYYNYWETTYTWGEGNIPDGCDFVYNKSATEVTATVNCTLARRGTIDPNNPSTFNWPEKLTYKLKMVASIQTKQVTSATLSFPQFNQVIDFREQTGEIRQGSPNGYEVLIMGAGGKLKTNDFYFLNVTIHFSEIL